VNRKYVVILLKIVDCVQSGLNGLKSGLSSSRNMLFIVI